MISPDEAHEIVARHARVLEPEAVDLAAAVGRVLAEDIAAMEDLPGFDNSAMDGYAVRSRDLARAGPGSPARLVVCGRRAAGSAAPLEVGSGQAARILTGAPIPPGADCVVIQEHSRVEGDAVELLEAAEAGQHVRPRGSDVRAGQKVLRAGSVLRPYEVAFLAAQGLGSVHVVRLPRVGVLATGDELAPAGAVPRPGQIRNANGPSLTAALARWGLPVEDGGTAADGPEPVREAVRRLLERSDVVLVSGGVSVGDFDCTREALLGLGFESAFWRVAIKQGKPLFFATSGRKLAFGLPGNPVAALVCLEEFVRPALERMQGLALRHPSYHLRGKALNGYPAAKDRRQYLFCVARQTEAGFELAVIRPQGSAMLGMACHANALALAEPGPVRRGDTLAFRWLK